MDGRYPYGLFFALTNCNDPANEEEFNSWYSHKHLPDVTGPGVWRHASRYVNTDPSPDNGKFLALYETYWDDVAAARNEMMQTDARVRELGRHSPHIRSVLVTTFKRLGGEFRAANRPARGILAVLAKLKDPAREEEFNRWYTDIHIPDILDTGLYHTAYRYEALDPQAAGAKYLAIYETDHSDPGKTGNELRKLRDNWAARGRLSDAHDVLYRITAQRIWPMG